MVIKPAEPAPRKSVTAQHVLTSKFVIKKKSECVSVMDSFLDTYFSKKEERSTSSTTLIVPWISHSERSLKKHRKLFNII